MSRLKKLLGLPWPTRYCYSKRWCCWPWRGRRSCCCPFDGWCACWANRKAQTAVLEAAGRTADVRRVAVMVRRASKNVPWTSKCLDQALAAKVMLAHRRISTTVYFGVNHDRQGRLAAHAWLRSGNLYVTGGAIRGRYTIINTFADEGA